MGPDGQVQLNPPMDQFIPYGAKAILIAEDDASIAMSTIAISVDPMAIRSAMTE